MTIQLKLENAIRNKRLRLYEGERNWYKYFLSIQELVWSRNNYDGYLIDVYDKKYGIHLCRLFV